MSTTIDEKVSRARELGLPTPEDFGNEDKPSIPTGLDSQRQGVEPLFADASVIRAALMDVIDVTEWKFYEGRDNGRYVREEVATAERGAFADAVEKRIRELQSSPFNLGLKLENFCDRHKRLRLPQPTSSSCSDCASELEKRRINDPD